jgi:hypothetical protein
VNVWFNASANVITKKRISFTKYVFAGTEPMMDIALPIAVLPCIVKIVHTVRKVLSDIWIATEVCVRSVI